MAGLALSLTASGVGLEGQGASRLSHRRLSPLLPDSLTTWEIHGVSLSKSTGAVTLFHSPLIQAPCFLLCS